MFTRLLIPIIVIVMLGALARPPLASLKMDEWWGVKVRRRWARLVEGLGAWRGWAGAQGRGAAWLRFSFNRWAAASILRLDLLRSVRRAALVAGDAA